MPVPTIYDVAAVAGVATSTVSRAFSTPGRVNASTREHVLAVAAELGYRPNPHARALLSGRHHTVAMVVSDITNPHYFELIRGAELRAKASEYTLVLVNAEESPRIEYDQIQRLVSSVDGFVLAASRLPDENLEQIAAQRPVVLMNRELTGLPSVVLDHVQGCRQIVEHLVSLGHRRLVYLAGPRNSWMASMRWSALRTAADDLGVDAQRVGPFTPKVTQGGAAADSALTTGASAVVAHNDLLAIGVVQRLAQRGVRVPEEVSVVGFDDIFASDLCTPSLTTLGGPHVEVGRAAVELLLDRTSPSGSRRTPPRLVVPAGLVLRGSTGPVAPR
ncbi:LacI family transcriptional regulator [Mumia sp. zg.B53]|uniref:LacI family DNA-binding transcriptional regulator n=1 Tax=unclassified Mumia TaxID=2621872 RepID=UPI001C6E3543|nr:MULTISPECIES: LacI family DNA-binding transcriptional regulator [unclassified Mumia]MBW9205873.1 LacI family transcriptional regulator [Mumia sp. zg.B17]MBW9208123.1 LacI family transcriptional regulator [Mumia sp. zg.B21]MBW9216078.1 LacI family transcriptional regulator [Mumia sp. zg.B53]MDD9348513.1 LacI family DNA-binding transcriptional regulator [Mumia sp.]